MSRKVISILALTCLTMPVMGQTSSTQNYIKTETMLGPDGLDNITTVQYYDGLGREQMSVQNGVNSNSGTSNTILHEYDACERQSKEWLPIAGYGTLYNSKITDSALDHKAYVSTTYDALDRPTFIYSPGQDMQGKGKKIEYFTNSANSVKKYKVSDSELTQDGYYAKGTLSGERVTDEDGHVIEVYKDLLGSIVLERRASDNDTYYVYDTTHQLRFVLSPEYQNDDDTELYAYEYDYDDRGNLTRKKLPQCEYIQYWYDNANRMICMQDGRMRTKGTYRYYLYDDLSRVVVECTCTSCIKDSTIIHTSFNPSQQGIMSTGYSTDKTISLENAKLEIVNYYDGYGFMNAQIIKGLPSYKELSGTFESKFANGRLTCTLTADTRDELLAHTYGYDIRGLVTEEKRTMLDKTVLNIKSTYTFAGKLEKAIKEIFRGRLAYRTTERNKYCHNSDKLVASETSFNGSNFNRVSNITYDNLGRLETLSHGPGRDVATASYTYDLRGWLKDITGKDFEEHLKYNVGTYGSPYYNGNISSQQWKTSKDSLMRGYRFSYDNLERLKNASYGEGAMYTKIGGCYDEMITGYTANGAIKGIKRKGKAQRGNYGIIDDLIVTLNGNQLKRVDDKADTVLRSGSFDFYDNKVKTNDAEYEYDENGALTMDANRGITKIEYDFRNNPTLIQFSDGSQTEYVYTASGEKLKAIHRKSTPYIQVPLQSTISGNTKGVVIPQSYEYIKPITIMSVDSTDYIENFIFENGKPDKYLFNGGFYTYASPTTGYTCYHYYITDHLGNNRVVVNGNDSIEQVIHYYPFGAVYADAGFNPNFQKYKYTGKELDLTHGLNTYDHGSRQSYSILGVWDRVDPLAEKYYNVSPYGVCGNNPIMFIDKRGTTVRIWYTNNKGHDKCSDFDGSSPTVIKNIFVLDFVHAYNYLRTHGTGKNVVKAVKSHKMGGIG